MAKRSSIRQTPLARSATRVFAANQRMNQMLLDSIDPALWNTKPSGKVRSIAAIFTHIHNVRTKWIRLNLRHVKVPPQLNRTRCSPLEAREALAQSAALCNRLLEESLGDEGRITTFRRDGWGAPWPAGVEMLCYMLVHEAHHRGQICLLAHQLGFPLKPSVTSRLWSWEKIWNELGVHRGSGTAPFTSQAGP